MKATFTYYKTSGKFYTSDSIEMETREIAPGGSYYLFFERVPNLIKEKKLPGLSTGTWDGFLTVTEEVSGLSHLYRINNE